MSKRANGIFVSEVSMEKIIVPSTGSAANYTNLIPARTNSPSGPVHMEERAVAISNELAKLQHYRDVIVFRNLQSLSFEEIANALDRSVHGQNANVIARALQKLKKFRTD